jgi:cytochrome c553
MNRTSRTSEGWPRLLTVCLLGGLAVLLPANERVAAAPPAAKPPATFGEAGFRKDVQPFLQKHCVDCHGPDEQNSNVRVDRFQNGFAVDDSILWTSIYKAIESGRMPPDSASQPAAAEKKTVSDWIREQSLAARKAHGSGSQRRLNRREFAALVTAALKLDLPQFATYLPGDRFIGGFDTLATGLQDATASINASQEAVFMLLRRVDFLEPKAEPSPTVRGDFRTGKAEYVGPPAKREWIRLGRIELGNGMVQPHFVNSFFRHAERGRGLEVAVRYDQADFDGFLRIRVNVASLAPEGVAPPTLRFNADRRVEITGDAEHPQTHEFLALPADTIPQVHRHKNVPDQYSYSFFLANQQTLPFDPAYVTDARGYPALPEEWTKAVKEKDFAYPASWLQLQNFEVESAYRQQWLTAEERAAISADDDGAMKVVRKLAGSVFRRPLSAAEEGWLASVYQKCRGEGLGLDDSIRLVAETIFASGPARTLLPTDVADQAQQQYAIASRLSFGLLCQPPDARLLELAAAGKLGERKVLEQEIERIVGQPECATGFVTPFTRMWLSLDQPKIVAQEKVSDLKKKTVEPDNLYLFREHILDGMNREAAAYFGIMLAENLPARELLDSDWLPMNDAMAYHYGYPRVIGHRFQKVKLRPDDPRGGGILGQAGVMSMTTWMGPNWPIYRGVWALRHVFNHPPPPAPLEVPALDHQEHKGQPIRVKLSAHTKLAACAVCHKTMDPAGYAFQHFDVSGRWREEEAEINQIDDGEEGGIYYKRRGKSWPVDASGSLPRGEAFKTWKEFKQLAVAHYSEDVARGQLQRYVRYFASREPTVSDEVVITQLLERRRKDGFPMRDMLRDFLTSEIFLGRRI